MFESPIISLTLFGALILIAAFLGSWIAVSLSARRKSVSIPELVEPEVNQETITASKPASKPDYPIKHAFDFTDEQITMILEMPLAILDDDAALANVWIDVVGWARISWQDIQNGVSVQDKQSEPKSKSLDESEITREHLEDALHRLHESAERRRTLRSKLTERQNGKTESVIEA